MKNNVDPDQMPHRAAFELGQYRLFRYVCPIAYGNYGGGKKKNVSYMCAKCDIFPSYYCDFYLLYTITCVNPKIAHYNFSRQYFDVFLFFFFFLCQFQNK